MTQSKRRLVPAMFLTVLVALSLCGTTEAVAAGKPPSTTKPAPRNIKFWTERNDELNARAKQGGVDLLFVGDSITHAWEAVKQVPNMANGQAVWDQYYAPRKAFNIGISGDGTEHVLWRLKHGNIDGLSPKLAVVVIGTNNNKSTPKQIAAGIKAVVKTLRKELPETKILLLAIFPRSEKPGELREKLAKASEMASRVADDKHVYYLDIGDAFLEKDGTLSREIMPDFLHPNEKGYRLWAEAMEPKVKELMGEK